MNGSWPSGAACWGWWRRTAACCSPPRPGLRAAVSAQGPTPRITSFTTSLLREAAPELDPDYTAHALLAALNAELVAYLRDDRSMSLEQVAEGFEGLVRGLVD